MQLAALATEYVCVHIMHANTRLKCFLMTTLPHTCECSYPSHLLVVGGDTLFYDDFQLHKVLARFTDLTVKHGAIGMGLID